MEEAEEIVSKMINGDAFSQWLGIEVMMVSEGFCKLEMTVRDEMTNGFNIAHGGISYSLAELSTSTTFFGKSFIICLES